MDEVTGVLEIVSLAKRVRIPGEVVVNGINIFSGNLSLSYSDLVVPGRGLSLSFARSYNQGLGNKFGPLGYGWVHGYQMLVLHDGGDDPSYTIVGGDGQGQQFLESKKNAQTGEIPSESPFHTRLVVNSDNSIDYFTKAHVKFHFPGPIERNSSHYFNAAYKGNLEYIEEPHSQRVTLTYDKFGRLEKVTDSSSRSLRFEYEEVQTAFVGTVVQTAANRTAAGCVRKGELRVLRDRLARSGVGKAWRITRVTGPAGIVIDYTYDGLGNLATVTRKGVDEVSEQTGDHVWEYEYKPELPTGKTHDVDHLLKSVRNPNDNATFYSYNFDTPASLVSQISFPETVANSFEYSFASREFQITRVKDGRGIETTCDITHSFNTNDQPTGHRIVSRIPLSSGFAENVTEFDEDGLKTVERDAQGLETNFEYDQRGNLKKETKLSRSGADSNLVTEFEYDPTFNKVVSATDANQNVTTYVIDPEKGDVMRVNLPTGRQIIMTYDGNGDLRTVTDERRLVTNYDDYDAYGNAKRITKHTDATGQVVITNDFDGRSRLTGTSSTIGPTIDYDYDALDRVVKRTADDPTDIRDSFVTSYTYEPAGQLKTEVITGEGQTYSAAYTYDLLDRLTTIVENGTGIEPLTRSYTYDKNSNLETVTDRRGVQTEYSYNNLNHVVMVEVSRAPMPAINVASMSVNNVGNPTSQTDHYGNNISFEYDSFHRLTKRTYPGNFTETMKLDGNGNILEFEDRNEKVTTYEYDPLNRPQEMTDPSSRVTTWAYDDAAGKVTMTRNPQGLVVETTTDGLNRPLTEKLKFGATEYLTSYAYNGRDVAVTDPRQTVISKKLSAFGEVGQTSVTLASLEILTTEMRYSALGGMKSFKDAKTRETTFQVDALGRTISATYPTSPSITERFGYDGENYLTSHTDRRGIASSMTHDSIGRPLVTTIGGVDVLTHTYEDSQRKVTKTDAENHSTTCQYDELMRLASLTNADGKTMTYEYDGVNLTKQSDFKGKKSEFAYDAVNRLTAIKIASPRELIKQLSSITTPAATRST